MKSKSIEIIVIAGVIEHLENPIKALRIIHQTFPQAELILTTTNATGVSNVIGALISRESQHKDHVSTFSVKTLYNVITRSGFEKFDILPYQAQFPEAIARSIFTGKISIICLEKVLRIIEFFFPLLSTGLVVHVPVRGQGERIMNKS